MKMMKNQRRFKTPNCRGGCVSRNPHSELRNLLDLESIGKGAGHGEWSQINRAVAVLTPQFARWNADLSTLVRESVMTIAGKE
jgi:hypothetical protein